MTAKEIATAAKKGGAKRLMLLHISQRYSGKEKLVLDEAKKTFKNSELAKDFMKIEI